LAGRSAAKADVMGNAKSSAASNTDVLMTHTILTRE
jgi:hypothetical protein